MSNNLKKWCYWLSLVGPIYDILRGAVIGIINVWIEVEAEGEHEKANRIYDAELERFRKDNAND